MAYKGNRNLERLDRVALGTGIGGKPRFIGPRLQIMLAGCFLLVAIAGLTMAIAGNPFGSDLAFVAMLSGLIMRAMGDWQKRGENPLDEREAAIMWKANAWGAIVPLVVIVLYTLLLSNFADDGWWVPAENYEWKAVSLTVLAAWGLISLIVDGWLTPNYVADLDDED